MIEIEHTCLRLNVFEIIRANSRLWVLQRATSSPLLDNWLISRLLIFGRWKRDLRFWSIRSWELNGRIVIRLTTSSPFLRVVVTNHTWVRYTLVLFFIITDYCFLKPSFGSCFDLLRRLITISVTLILVIWFIDFRCRTRITILMLTLT
jgi:hypothetical protein